MITRRGLFAAAAVAALLPAIPAVAAAVSAPIVIAQGSAGIGIHNFLSVTTTVDAPAGSTNVIIGYTASSWANVLDSVATPYTVGHFSYGAAAHLGLGYDISTPLDLPAGGSATVRSGDMAGGYAVIAISIQGAVALGSQMSVFGVTSRGPTLATSPQDANSLTVGPLIHANATAIGHIIGPTNAGTPSTPGGWTPLTSQTTTDGNTIWVFQISPATPAPVYFDPQFSSSVLWAAKVNVFYGPQPLPPTWLRPLPDSQTLPIMGLNFGGGINQSSVGLTVSTPALGCKAYLVKLGTAAPDQLAQAVIQGQLAVAQGNFLMVRICNTLGAVPGQSGPSVGLNSDADVTAYKANLTTIIKALLPYMGTTPIFQCDGEVDNSSFWPGIAKFTGSLNGNAGTVNAGPAPPVNSVIWGSATQPQNVLSVYGNTFFVDGNPQTYGSLPLTWGTSTDIATQTAASYLGMLKVFCQVVHSLGGIAVDGAITRLGQNAAYWYELRSLNRAADADFFYAAMYAPAAATQNYAYQVPNVARPDIPTYPTNPQLQASLIMPQLVWAGLVAAGVDIQQLHWQAVSPELAYSYDQLRWAQQKTGLPIMMEGWTRDNTAAGVQAVQFLMSKMGCAYATWFSATGSNPVATPIADPTTGVPNAYGAAFADAVARRVPLPNKSPAPSALTGRRRAWNIR